MMIWLQSLSLGVKSLWLHPMRSLLTVLGIFIGVSSVIWLLAISKGIGDEASRQIEALGADTIMVRSVKPPSEKMATSGMTPYGLTRQEFDMLISTIPTIKSALPIREIQRKFQNGTEAVDGRLVGCTPDYAEANRLVVSRGHFITDVETMNRDNVCVLAGPVAERLFPLEDPLGKRIYMPESTDYYLVVGVLEPRAASAAVGGSMAAQDYSKDVYIPITTLQQRIGDTVMTARGSSREAEIVELNQITLKVGHIRDVHRTAELVEDALSSHFGANSMQDVAVVVPLELLEQARTTRAMFMVFMGMIAAISLLVGGIGIMNIMLATVTERTREIGIRRALGAKRADIVRQFLVETTVLSVVGGTCGILFGLLCGPAVNLVRGLVFKWAPETMAALPEVVRTVQPSIVPESIPIAFYISLMVGIVFGIYPAFRAARMNPIEALRHE